MDATNIAADIRNRGGASGISGAMGPQGPQGPAGPQGIPGTPGDDGISAYEVAVANGFIGTEAEWLASLEGTDGSNGVGVPIGGTAGQVLAKVDGSDYNTEWVNQTGGGGSGSGIATNVEIYVKNETGTTLTKGQVVYINGSNGNNITIALSKADTEATSSKTVGLLKQNLTNGSHGYVVTEGILEGLNTDGLTAGDPMWLSPTTAGSVVYGLANKPSAPNHMVYLGVVERIQSVNGSVYVKVQNGFELNELHNVALSSVENGQTISYDSSTSLWKNTYATATTIKVKIWNDTTLDGSITLTKGTAVYGLPTIGSQVLRVSRRGINTFSPDGKMYGIVEEDIPFGGYGYMITYGFAYVNTTFSPVTPGLVYLNSTNGLLTTTRPTEPNFIIRMGVVHDANSIFVDIDYNILTLTDLANVYITTPTDGQYLKYNNSTSLWVNATLPTIPTTLDSLTNVTAPTPTDGQVLTYNSATSEWVAAAGGGGGSNTRTTTELITPIMAANGSLKTSITIAPGYRLYSITTNVPARVRLYADTAGQDNDFSRVPTVIPTDGNGLILEYITTFGFTSAPLSPLVDGFTVEGDSIVPITINNTYGTASIITVSFTYIKTEG